MKSDLTSQHLVVIAGEPSGDLRAASVVRDLLSTDPSLKITGIGGGHMRDAGVRCIEDIKNLSVMGFTEVIKHYPRLRKIFHNTLDHIRQTKPDAVLLVDYPGFNLRLAKKIKELNLGIKVLYYVSPTIWAWKEHRVHAIRQYTDRMMVLFPFEKKYYKDKWNMDVDYVGHPIVNEIKVTQERIPFMNEHNLLPNKTTIGLIPGSRFNEVKTLLPIMLDAAQKINKRVSNVQFVVSCTDSIDSAVYDDILKTSTLSVERSNNFYNTVNASDCCIATAGTAVLEVGLMQKPVVAIYKASWITYWITMALLKIKNVTLINIVLQEKVIEELIQNNATAQNIVEETLRLLPGETKYTQLRERFKQLHHQLDTPDTTPAKVILQELKK